MPQLRHISSFHVAFPLCIYTKLPDAISQPGDSCGNETTQDEQPLLLHPHSYDN